MNRHKVYKLLLKYEIFNKQFGVALKYQRNMQREEKEFITKRKSYSNMKNKYSPHYMQFVEI